MHRTTLYRDLCEKVGQQVDRCVLCGFHGAVYYASESGHDPEPLKWWNGKDAHRRGGTCGASLYSADISSVWSKPHGSWG